MEARLFWQQLPHMYPLRVIKDVRNEYRNGYYDDLIDVIKKMYVFGETPAQLELIR